MKTFMLCILTSKSLQSANLASRKYMEILGVVAWTGWSSLENDQRIVDLFNMDLLYGICWFWYQLYLTAAVVVSISGPHWGRQCRRPVKAWKWLLYKKVRAAKACCRAPHFPTTFENDARFTSSVHWFAEWLASLPSVCLTFWHQNVPTRLHDRILEKKLKCMFSSQVCSFSVCLSW